MNTPVAAAISIPTENSIAVVPTARDTGIRRTATVDATMTLPPTSIDVMEGIPVAVRAMPAVDATMTLPSTSITGELEALPVAVGVYVVSET